MAPVSNVTMLVLATVAVALLAAATGYRLGRALEADAGRALEADAWRAYADDWRADAGDWRGRVDDVRRVAFARAAEAVGIWPHRVTRRADLVRHLLSLADAPDLGADLPDDDDAAPLVLSRRAEPVVAEPVPSDDEETDGAESPVDVYRAEGFR